MATIGWSQERTDEVLVPVIRDMNQRSSEGVQSNITRFFAGGVGVGAAVTGRGIGGANGKAGADVEGTAPRNRTGKESGRMKNAYRRLRGEAEKEKRKRALGDDGKEVVRVAEADVLGVEGMVGIGEEDDVDTANGDGHKADEDKDDEASSSDKPRRKARKTKKQSTASAGTGAKGKRTTRKKKAVNDD